MKMHLYNWSIITIILVAAAGNLAAQESIGGTVKYAQITSYDFEGMLGERENDPRRRRWIESLPKEGKKAKVLYFTDEEALYGDDQTELDERNRGMRMAMFWADRNKTPVPTLMSVYYDFDKNRKTEQLEFMTREFLLTKDIERVPWKLTGKNIKILDRMCFSAELTDGDQSVTAWFTSEIPVPTGPDKYIGLPGLILAVEIDGETAYLATSIDMALPSSDELTRPRDGKKVSQKKFDKIMAEKLEEIEETQGEGGEGMGRGHGRGRRGDHR